MSALDVVAAVLIVAGAALGTLGGVGLIRLPDLFGRMHAATKAPTLGLVLVAVGAAMRVDSASDIMFLALVVGLQFLTAPVGAHLISRSAYDAGVPMSEDTVLDELEDAAPDPAPETAGPDAGSGVD